MNKILTILIVFTLTITGTIAVQAATNSQYCVNPVYSVNPVKPNVLILEDVTGSMAYQAYSRGATSYDPSSPYYGQFDKSKCYVYSTTNGRFESTTGCDCSDKIGYVNSATDQCMSGNLLNWATMSRFDVSKKVLTGGKPLTSTVGEDTVVSEGDAATVTVTLPGDDRACSFVITNSSGIRKLQIKGKNCTSTDCHTVDTNCRYEDTNCRQVRDDPPVVVCDNARCTRWHYKTHTVCDSTLVCDHTTVCSETCSVCNLGDSIITNANIRVKQDGVSAANPLKGIVHNFYDLVNFEYMTFEGSTYGAMDSGKGASLSSLVSTINNKITGGGTPTGPAMMSAFKYYTQGTRNDYNGTTTASLGLNISPKNGTYDPYYDVDALGVSNAVPCRKSFILLISDGEWNAGADPVGVAYKLHTSDLRTGDIKLTTEQLVTTYSIYTFGDSVQGANAMKSIALFGGFEGYSSTNQWPYTFTALPSSSLTTTWPRTNCNPDGTWNSLCSTWDKSQITTDTPKHTGLPYNYYEASKGDEIVKAITSALNDMVRRASSGTAASVLGSAEGSGANLLQSYYYPRRSFDEGDVTWIGEMQNLWFYIDPKLGNSSIREDTNGNNILDVSGDNILEYTFDTTYNKTKIKRFAAASDGSKGSEVSPSPVEIDEAKSLWEAGAMLWKRDISTNPRDIFTSLDGTTKIPFTSDYASTLYSYMNMEGASSSDLIANAEKVIDFVNGAYVEGFRNRAVTMTYKGETGSHIWKLGDIVSSTPRLKSGAWVNSYHKYPPDGYADETYKLFIDDLDADGNPKGHYKERGMVYVGANDGMLHAFEMGKISFDDLADGQAAKLLTVDSPVGTERWAYIPKNALPYLKYLADPNYCHVYFADSPVFVVDSSSQADPGAEKTRDSWRTIIIGGMGIGGACRNTTQSCVGGGTECTKTPIANVGFSSYFAIDVTNPTSPQLLWEFSSDQLGYATTGPGIVRVGDRKKNGKWFVVFANGPTGYVDTSYNQLKAMSDQPLKLFAFDLVAGPGSSNANVKTITTDITNAFGGSLVFSTLDTDRFNANRPGIYQDDVLYFGYTKKDATAGTWTKGGVARVITNENDDPGSWTVSKVIDNIGPVTSSIGRLQTHHSNPENNNVWLYFGTGRYWYKTNEIDDASNIQSLYGIKDPCYNQNTEKMTAGCTTLAKGDLNDQTSSIEENIAAPGWYINLNGPTSVVSESEVVTRYSAERVIATPVVLYNGIVAFVSIAPSADVCSMGGTSYVWVTWFANGGLPPASVLQGKVMVQVSSGKIALKDIGDGSSGDKRKIYLDDQNKGESSGTAGGGGGSLMVPPRPLQKILNIKER